MDRDSPVAPNGNPGPNLGERILAGSGPAETGRFRLETIAAQFRTTAKDALLEALILEKFAVTATDTQIIKFLKAWDEQLTR